MFRFIRNPLTAPELLKQEKQNKFKSLRYSSKILNPGRGTAEREFEGLVMKIYFVYFLLFTGSLAFAEESEEEPKYCDEPKFSIRNNQLVNPAMSLPLVSAEESRDPEIGRKLASEPGPYGHSELGFRYLSRLFGYPGEFGDKSKVEEWLTDQEIKHYNSKRGLRAAWDQWVVNPAKRLAVPPGPVSKIPAMADVDVFFPNRLYQHDFERCVTVQLKVLSCENYLGDRKIEPDDRVYLANSESARSSCKLVRNPYGYEARRLKELQDKMNGNSGVSGNVRSAQ
jgi:hypothetical protein